MSVAKRPTEVRDTGAHAFWALSSSRVRSFRRGWSPVMRAGRKASQSRARSASLPPSSSPGEPPVGQPDRQAELARAGCAQDSPPPPVFVPPPPPEEPPLEPPLEEGVPDGGVPP